VSVLGGGGGGGGGGFGDDGGDGGDDDLLMSLHEVGLEGLMSNTRPGDLEY